MMIRKELRNLSTGLAFLAPNIAGFLIFTAFPLVLSLVLAFSNWDLRLHNRFKDQAIRFTFLENFVHLLGNDDFWRFLGNTLFLMMGIPFGIAASLGAALLLSREVGGHHRVVRATIIAVTVMTSGVIMLTVLGAGATGVVILLAGLACGTLVGGAMGGMTLYRTLFYLPSFTSGIAIYILWSKLYDSHTGPINTALRPMLDRLADVINVMPAALAPAGTWLCAVVMSIILGFSLRWLRMMWLRGDVGSAAAISAGLSLLLPVILAQWWMPSRAVAITLAVLSAVMIVWQIRHAVADGMFPCNLWTGFGSASMLGLASVVAQFVLLGVGIVIFHLPAMATDGLEPPQWLTQYHWAKPALMIMSLWAAIGSNSMLLYLAALSNIPQELMEAADIDGAGRFTRFWNVTWPQLAPTTFFIVVMGCIGGLQGGFEMAAAMTSGGPAGSTTVLSYFIYNEAFEVGRLGYASAVAWIMFLMILAITLVNWKFGNRYVNE